LDGTGEVYRDLGQPDEAIGFHLQAAAVHRRLGDAWQLAIALGNLAAALVDAGRADEAFPYRREALTLLRQFADARASALSARVGLAPPHLR
jgi:tetratricopeptide (TPR) repeat protein